MEGLPRSKMLDVRASRLVDYAVEFRGQSAEDFECFECLSIFRPYVNLKDYVTGTTQ
jgi:hypothetical protein